MTPTPPFQTIDDYKRHLDAILEQQRVQIENPFMGRFINEQMLANPLPIVVAYNPNTLPIDAQTITQTAIKNINNIYFPFGDAPQFSNFQPQVITQNDTSMSNINSAHLQHIIPSQALNQTQPLQPTPQPTGHITLAEIAKRREITNLINPEARLMDALGISRQERLIAPPLIRINAEDSLSVLNAKMDIICNRIEQNKAFWKQTFDALNPGASKSALYQPPTLVYKYANNTPDLSGLSSAEKRAALDKSVDSFRIEKQELEACEEKYAILAKDIPKENEISTIPFTAETEEQISNFNRGAHDDECLTYYLKNQIAFQEGSEFRKSKDFLEKEIKGPGKGVGANFAYFAGALKNRISHLFQSEVPSPILASIPSSETAKNIILAVCKINPLLKNLNLSEKLKTVFEISDLVEEKSIAIQLSAQGGSNLEELIQDAFSATYTAGLSGNMPSSFISWDKKLLSGSKGALHGTLDFLYQTWEDIERVSFYTGVNGLENLLTLDERVEINQHLNQTVERHTSSVSSFIQKTLGLDPYDTAYLSARKFTHIGLNLATLAAGAYGILKNTYLLRQASRLPMRLQALAARRPKALAGIFEKLTLDTGNRFKQLKLNPSYAGQQKAGRLFEVISQKNNQLTNLVNSYINLTFQESIQLHRNARNFLKPYIKTFMPDSQVRALIHKTKIPTFPRPKGVPENYIVRISNEGAGMIYRHPTNKGTYIRVMPGKPHSPWPYQKNPYVVQMKDGNTFDKFANIVSRDAPEAHIPIQEFIYHGE